ncbi:MAG TPA: trypsin-like peptidase domain-containing protein [Candidatus Pullichristensenella excrementigallinarum]|uniref:Trypsin-like peptidase domain-containing protein n=1 Tax=Candidatus Pullichristensenella excrementigallinarum TaxID=2840907 RepID=A0A9D1IF60_9FIRM|nr:trypsin-like peptidase domain-containing protein [Candidatus Pullichristensenella excrementigallinarum]
MKKNSAFKRISFILAIVLCLGIIGTGVAYQRTQQAASAESGTVGYDSIYSSTNPVPEIAANVRPSVVLVTTYVESWNRQTRQVESQAYGYGSGTYIQTDEDGTGGYILTNNHVIDAGDDTNTSYEIEWLDGTVMDATLVGADDGTDIAVLKFEQSAPSDATPVPMGDSDQLQIGELAIVIGNPGSGDEVLFGTVTAGIISGLEREGVSASGSFTRSVSVIQVDAAINTGNSGGALLNSKGELIGIPTLKMMYNYSSIFEGLGFCVPINTVKDVINQLIETGKVVRPRMGVTVADFENGPDEPMRNYPPAGVQVISVEEGTPAEAAGLQANDIITEVDGERIYTTSELMARIDELSAGDTMEIKAYRYYDENGNKLDDYQELNLTVELQIIDE